MINRYIGLVLERQQARSRDGGAACAASFRHGDGTSEILSVELLNARGEAVTSVASGEPITVRVRSRVPRGEQIPWWAS